jgi:hypothetical protein
LHGRHKGRSLPLRKMGDALAAGMPVGNPAPGDDMFTDTVHPPWCGFL